MKQRIKFFLYKILLSVIISVITPFYSLYCYKTCEGSLIYIWSIYSVDFGLMLYKLINISAITLLISKFVVAMFLLFFIPLDKLKKIQAFIIIVFITILITFSIVLFYNYSTTEGKAFRFYYQIRPGMNDSEIDKLAYDIGGFTIYESYQKTYYKDIDLIQIGEPGYYSKIFDYVKNYCNSYKSMSDDIFNRYYEVKVCFNPEDNTITKMIVLSNVIIKIKKTSEFDEKDYTCAYLVNKYLLSQEDYTICMDQLKNTEIYGTS